MFCFCLFTHCSWLKSAKRLPVSRFFDMHESSGNGQIFYQKCQVIAVCWAFDFRKMTEMPRALLMILGRVEMIKGHLVNHFDLFEKTKFRPYIKNQAREFSSRINGISLLVYFCQCQREEKEETRPCCAVKSFTLWTTFLST